MRLTVIPVVIGVLGTVSKGFAKGLEELEIVIIQTIALFRSARILRRVLETWKVCCHSDSSGIPLLKAVVNNSQGVK